MGDFMSITKVTRRESYMQVNRNRMYDLILKTLIKNHQGLTAREIAIILYNNGESYTNDRQATAPRLTELTAKNKVKVVGKRLDNITNKWVAIYKINIGETTNE